MNDVAVRLEHVDLLDSLDGLGVELLQSLLELLVIGSGAGGRTLDLAAGGTLSTRVYVSCEFGRDAALQPRRRGNEDIPYT